MTSTPQHDAPITDGPVPLADAFTDPVLASMPTGPLAGETGLITPGGAWAPGGTVDWLLAPHLEAMLADEELSEIVSMLVGPSSKLIADSVTAAGERLATWEIVIHRFVLAELNTHRSLAKNSGSSRAIPVQKQIDNLRRSPAFPVHWGAEQRGMQSGASLQGDDLFLAQNQWHRLMESTIKVALELRELGLHKSLTNRLVEPYSFHKVCLTGSAVLNLFRQRDEVNAQPEIAAVAKLMHEQWRVSNPAPLNEGDWHTPYISENDRDQVTDRFAKAFAGGIATTDDRIAISVHEFGVERTLARASSARCARTSYLTNPVIGAGGEIVEAAAVSLDRDFDLYERLVADEPRHWSPLEHPATPWPENRQDGSLPFSIGDKDYFTPLSHLPKVGCFVGYRTLRTEVETMLGDVTYV